MRTKANSEREGSASEPVLLAVDLGLRTGLACFAADGRLCWHRSHNFGTTERLRLGVASILDGLPGLRQVILEGGGSLARVWTRAALRRNLLTRTINAEIWRAKLLLPYQQRSGETAKQVAIQLARRVITWSGLSQPKSLRHDAAEAILVGLWAALLDGAITALPWDHQY